eukprot:TRINITY_DN10427_c0_g2_i1.p1 TRINITY_DN10427_c0_g2~~TRINITY_DN10427_c0_g2_i1.p1  ORF type:complete len:310 (-),score=54.62 TRINITY_DN10427_c0_g2_i1:138-1010(-)
MAAQSLSLTLSLSLRSLWRPQSFTASKFVCNSIRCSNSNSNSSSCLCSCSCSTSTHFSKSSPIHPFPSRSFHVSSTSGFLFSRNGKSIFTQATCWKSEKTPYETLELDRNAGEEDIKAAYRRLAKQYHPDVYDGNGDLEEGETAELRFIKIQAAYELLMDRDQRLNYDRDNRMNPNKANKAWMEWMMKKKKAFEQQGDLAAIIWAEQQQLELNIRVRQRSRTKDPEELRKILARERKASADYLNSTMRRHNLVLKRREILRRKSEEERKSTLKQLLESEGLELDSDDGNK